MPSARPTCTGWRDRACDARPSSRSPAAFAAYVLAVATGHGASTPATALYSALLFCGALVCFARVVAVDDRPRSAWALMGLGLAVWAAADLGWTFVLGKLEAPPYPSLADAGWLAWYPCSYAAVMLLLRSRRRSLPAGLWLDGAIAALGASALVAAVVLEPVLAGAVEGAAARGGHEPRLPGRRPASC